MSASERFGAQQRAVEDVLRVVLGPQCHVDGVHVLTADGGYCVLRVELRTPDRTVVVKLCDPDDPRASGFARAAAFARLVLGRSDVPIYDVIAVDASGDRSPWAYFITSQIDGRHWNEVTPFLDPGDQRALYEQLGRAVASLHSLRFPCYGAMAADGAIVPAARYLDALAAWAEQHIADRAYAALFLGLLQERAELFADIGTPQLTHEDLNPNNLLVSHADGAWRLAGVLDFDKAWAGCGESDLARLELWRGMTGDAFWQGYISTLPIPAGYSDRRALYQLLWCLEYARPTAEHIADTAAVCSALGIPPMVFTGATLSR
jgi:hygromycin-B 7''-O-kinase